MLHINKDFSIAFVLPPFKVSSDSTFFSDMMFVLFAVRDMTRILVSRDAHRARAAGRFPSQNTQDYREKSTS